MIYDFVICGAGPVGAYLAWKLSENKNTVLLLDRKKDITKIFDPFFTTKPLGQGTGLGLSVGYGIIKRHGGKITVRNRSGRGTEFSIKLPAYSEENHT